MSKNIQVDPVTGIITMAEVTPEGKLVVDRRQDCQDILDSNAADRAAAGSGFGGGDLHKVASIPLIIWEKWMQELKSQGLNPDPGAKDNRVWLMARLNSGDWKALRTKEGRL